MNSVVWNGELAAVAKHRMPRSNYWLFNIHSSQCAQNLHFHQNCVDSIETTVWRNESVLVLHWLLNTTLAIMPPNKVQECSTVLRQHEVSYITVKPLFNDTFTHVHTIYYSPITHSQKHYS